MPQGEASSTIFDLGYARYEGGRGGRLSVILALYVFSLRSIFGLGRRHTAKIVPAVLAAITFLPAIAQLGIAALAASAIDVFRPEEYYGFINWTLALFVAATATDLVGRDRRSQVLSLYFARGLEREDYVAAKYAAAASALLALTLVPQAVLFIGNGLAVDDPFGYLGDHWDDLAPIAGSAIAIALYLAAIGLLAASLTTRRSFAAGIIVAYFAVGGALAGAAVEFGSEGLRQWAPLLSGFDLLTGTTYWLFDATPDPASLVGRAGLSLAWYGVALAGLVVAALALLQQRYRGLRL